MICAIKVRKILFKKPQCPKIYLPIIPKIVYNLTFLDKEFTKRDFSKFLELILVYYLYLPCVLHGNKFID